MPETPDFVKIATAVVEQLVSHPTELVRRRADDDVILPLVEELRRVWNARGTADIATLELLLSEDLEEGRPSRVVTMKTLDHALRKLDR